MLEAHLKLGETLGDRVMKVNHAGEHGAINIYRAQRWFARFRAPELLDEIDNFLAHERKHRAIFASELERRGRPKCRSFHLCGLGGLALGSITGLAGRHAILATTVAVEAVVLRHLEDQYHALKTIDPAGAAAVEAIIVDEREHHDASLRRTNDDGFWFKLFYPIVSVSTEVVIWLGMKL